MPRRRVKRKANRGDLVQGRSANFNRRKTKLKLGDHLIQCDVTGQVCFRSEATLTWRGILASNQNWDRKHPQLTINVFPEDISAANARPFKSTDETFGSDIVDDSSDSVSISDQTVEST